MCPAEATVNYNWTNSSSPVRGDQEHVWGGAFLSLRSCMHLCIRHHTSSFVCLHLAGCEKRQRLDESCRETLQGLERMLIKASYSTASSFLTVPAAGSTTLCFLTTSSPLSLSALLYFCLLLLLSSSFPVSFPICVSLASFRSVLHLHSGSSNSRCLGFSSTVCIIVEFFSKLKICQMQSESRLETQTVVFTCYLHCFS